MVIGNDNRVIYMAGRNIRNCNVKPLGEIHTYDVLSSENVIFADKELIERTKEVVSL